MRYLRILLSLGILLIFSGDNYLFAQELYKVLEADTRGIFGLRWDQPGRSRSQDISIGLLSVSRMRFYSTSSFDDIYRERTADHTAKINRFTQLSRLEMPINHGKSGAAIGLEYAYSSSYAHKKSLSNQEFILERKFERYAFGAGRRFFSNRIDLSGSVGSSNVLDKMKRDYAINMRFHPSEKYSFMSSVISRSSSLNIDLNVESEKLPVTSSSTNDKWAVGFEVMPKEYVLIDMKYERGRTYSGEESNLIEGYRLE